MSSETDTVSIIVHDSRPAGLPVVVGCPFPSDQVSGDCQSATVRYEDGVEVVAQCVPLTPPTAVGVRWVELSFLAEEADVASVVLDGPGKDARPNLGRSCDTNVVLHNGLIRVALNNE
jgi:hypothetical protein